jgi:hypothetical protein
VTSAVQGEAAGELWDAMGLLTACDGFRELRRAGDAKPVLARR